MRRPLDPAWLRFALVVDPNAEGCDPDNPVAVVDDDTGETVSCHPTAEAAQAVIDGAEGDDDMAVLPATAVLVVAEEGVETGDGRFVEAGALTWRDLPLSLTRNHDPDQIVGRIDAIGRVASLDNLTVDTFDELAAPAWDGANPLVVGRVTFDLDADQGREAARMVEHGFLRGVSMELSDEVVEFECRGDESDGFCDGDVLMRFVEGRIGAVTLTPFQAIESARVLVASAIPTVPPADWFDDPGLTEPTGLTWTDDGRVFGHITLWGECHTSHAHECLLAPRSATGYAYFRTGLVRALSADGSPVDVPVGCLTVDTEHAGLRLSAASTVRHYENTGTAVADVAAGEDEHGVWIAGAARPNLTDVQWRQVRAAKPSGDWRPIKGRLELVSILGVNTPGFPVPRALVAGGERLALVASAGQPRGCGCSHGVDDVVDDVDALTGRVARLEVLADVLGWTDAAVERLDATIR